MTRTNNQTFYSALLEFLESEDFSFYARQFITSVVTEIDGEIVRSDGAVLSIREPPYSDCVDNILDEALEDFKDALSEVAEEWR